MNLRMKWNAAHSAAKLLPSVFALAFLGACQSGPTEGEMAARSEADQLKNELASRDSLIGEMALSFDDIEKNIALMDDRERMLGESAEGELNMDQRQKIVRDRSASRVFFAPRDSSVVRENLAHLIEQARWWRRWWW